MTYSSLSIIGLAVFFLFAAFLSKKRNFFFFAAITCYLSYCAIFIFNSSFVANGIRYFTLFDDAMVGMRYAHNLARGFGLIWNPAGERVEGYTNPLWTIYMAFWHLFPIASAKISLLIQLTGSAFLISSLFLVRKIANYISGGNALVIIGSVLLTATYLPINFWALKGMETSALGFIVLLAIWRLLMCLESDRFDPYLAGILGLGMLLRVDFVFLFIVFLVFMITALRVNRIKNGIFFLGIFIVIFGGQTLLRWLYYGDLLPNTYYLKMTGLPLALRVQRGFFAAIDFIEAMSGILFVLPFLCLIFHRKNKAVIFLACIFSFQLLYSIYVGADAWEWWGNLANRYLCIVMPVFFILISLAVGWLMEKMRQGRLKNTFFAVIMLFLIFQLHGGSRNLDLIREQLLGASGIFIDIDKKMAATGLQFKEFTTPQVKIAVTWAGIIPYFSDRYSIDLLGKNDKVIAREAVKAKTYRDFRPGHNKYDYEYSIGKLRPDVIAQYWGAYEEFAPYLKDYEAVEMKNGCTIYLLKGSVNILRERLKDFSRS